MATQSISNVLLASPDPALLSQIEAVLTERGAHADFALSAQAALALLSAPTVYDLVLLDANLPGMETAQLLAAVRDASDSRRFPIVLISNSVSSEMRDRLAEGVIDDIVPASTDTSFWQVRLDAVLRAHHAVSEFDALHESSAMNAQYDRLTGIYNRETILSMLFRETDRVQRMKSSLSMVLFDVDEFGHWNSRLGAEVCDQLMIQIVSRTSRLLRSYDLFGRVGKDEFLVAMPGASSVSAVMLAERLRAEVFSEPYHVAGEGVRLSACFGISSSQGRSPLVVLREAERAMSISRRLGPESIECFSECPLPDADPVTFLSPTSGEKLLAW